MADAERSFEIIMVHIATAEEKIQAILERLQEVRERDREERLLVTSEEAPMALIYDPTRLIDPPAVPLGFIPDSLLHFAEKHGAEEALSAWWRSIHKGDSRELFAGRVEAMARLIEMDPDCALADMRLCQRRRIVEKPIDLDDLALRAEGRAKLTHDRDARDDLYLIADQLKWRCERQATKEADALGTHAQLNREATEPLDTKNLGYTHLTPALIARLAREGDPDLTERRIEQLVAAAVRAARRRAA